MHKLLNVIMLMSILRQAESMNACGNEVKGLVTDRYNRPDFRNVTIEN